MLVMNAFWALYDHLNSGLRWLGFIFLVDVSLYSVYVKIRIWIFRLFLFRSYSLHFRAFYTRVIFFECVRNCVNSVLFGFMKADKWMMFDIQFKKEHRNLLHLLWDVVNGISDLKKMNKGKKCWIAWLAFISTSLYNDVIWLKIKIIVSTFQFLG